MSTTYSYKTEIGTFTIRPGKMGKRTFELCMVENEKTTTEVGSFLDLDSVIDAIANQQTGYYKWDFLDAAKVPENIRDISFWTAVHSKPK